MRTLHSLVAIALVLSTAVTIWWLVGDLSTVDPAQIEPDYVMRPSLVSAEAERVIGTAALLLAVGTGTGLVDATRRGSMTPKCWLVILPWLTVAAFCGLAYRAVTAAVLGANMLWGMLQLAGPPFICAMVITSCRQGEKVKNGS